MNYRAKPLNPAMPVPDRMQATVLKSVRLPIVGTGIGTPVGAGGLSNQPARPVVIADASAVPSRVEITNLAGTADFGAAAPAFIGFDSMDVQAPQGPGAQAYVLPAGASRVFLVARGQKMYGAARVDGVVVTVQIAELSDGGYPFND